MCRGVFTFALSILRLRNEEEKGEVERMHWENASTRTGRLYCHRSLSVT